MASPASSHPPDFFSTLPTKELQARLRKATTLPLETLLNKRGVHVDYAERRIQRDCFWKGSFAKDTALGWAEKIASLGLGAGNQPPFASGSFWKRFDEIEDGVATGEVINYELETLPGFPEVREVRYPKGDRAYFAQNDPILLLKYRNAPYRIVYDTIKVIDEDSAIGVMHLGNFPNGLEFATFVMERHNYPFEKMTVDDYEMLLSLEEPAEASPADLVGTWEGRLLTYQDPERVLLGLTNPHKVNLTIEDSPQGLIVHYRFGIFSTTGVFEDTTVFRQQAGGDKPFVFHLTSGGTLLGRVATDDWKLALLPGRQQYIDSEDGKLTFYLEAERVQQPQ